MLAAAILVDPALVQYAYEKGGPWRTALEADIGRQAYQQLKEALDQGVAPPPTIRVSVDG